MVSSITDPTFIRGGRMGDKKRKQSVGDFKRCWSSANFVYRTEVGVLEKLGKNWPNSFF